jgi:hypothetical protein
MLMTAGAGTACVLVLAVLAVGFGGRIEERRLLDRLRLSFGG